MNLIDALHANAAIKDVDLIDRAWLLGDPPKRWEGLIEKLQQQGLAGERWPEVSDQAPTLYVVWGGGATPQQALHMVGLILPPKAAA
jgi:hypothetical protein